MKNKQPEISFKQRFIITLIATLTVALVHNYSTSEETEAVPSTAPIVQTAAR